MQHLLNRNTIRRKLLKNVKAVYQSAMAELCADLHDDRIDESTYTEISGEIDNDLRTLDVKLQALETIPRT